MGVLVTAKKAQLCGYCGLGQRSSWNQYYNQDPRPNRKTFAEFLKNGATEEWFMEEGSPYRDDHRLLAVIAAIREKFGE